MALTQTTSMIIRFKMHKPKYSLKIKKKNIKPNQSFLFGSIINHFSGMVSV